MRSSALQNLTTKINQTVERISVWSVEAQPTCNEYYGGDPRNAFHALRQFLLLQGIDTRVFTFGSVALPEAMGASNTEFVGTIDNSFYFEFHKLLTPDNENCPKVNVLVLLVRCFFEGTQDSTTLHVQLVLNHHRDAVYELNEVYDYLIQTAVADNWEQPTSESTCGRITFFEKTYNDFRDFKHFVLKMQKELAAHETIGNNLVPSATCYP